MDPLDLDNRFMYHPPDEDARNRHERARTIFRSVADGVEVLAPDCREKSLAITALEEALFWTNAAIARTVSSHDPTRR